MERPSLNFAKHGHVNEFEGKLLLWRKELLDWACRYGMAHLSKQ